MTLTIDSLITLSDLWKSFQVV